MGTGKLPVLPGETTALGRMSLEGGGAGSTGSLPVQEVKGEAKGCATHCV